MALQQLFLHLHLRDRQIISSQSRQLLLNIYAAQRVAIRALFLEAFSFCFQLLSDHCSNLRVASELIFGELALVKLQLVFSTLPRVRVKQECALFPCCTFSDLFENFVCLEILRDIEYRDLSVRQGFTRSNSGPLVWDFEDGLLRGRSVFTLLIRLTVRGQLQEVVEGCLLCIHY